MRNKAFTLLELIIVLALLAILASVAAAKLIDISQKAFQVQEEATIAALRSAALLYHTKVCLDGDCHWFGNKNNETNPFLLLENPPSYLYGPPVGGADNRNWRYGLKDTTNFLIMIWCPHAPWASPYDGNMWRFYYNGESAGRIIHDWDMPIGIRWGYKGHQDLYANRH